RVLLQQRRQLGDRGRAVPGDGDALLARVGPVVAVVEVDQQAHARVLDLLAEVDGMRDVVVAVRLVVAVGGLRVDERPQADVVEAVLLHDREYIRAPRERPALLIGDVGADEEAERQRVHAGAGRSGAAAAGAAGGSAAPARARRAGGATAPARARRGRGAPAPRPARRTGARGLCRLPASAPAAPVVAPLPAGPAAPPVPPAAAPPLPAAPLVP